MLKVALTGGIGCGKSTAANIFAQWGAPVIDADQISHALVEPGAPALLEITRQFGPGILDSHGALDRSKLRMLVFSRPDCKHQLEAILHPLVYAEMQHLLQTLHYPYVILCIPLLLETKMQHFVDRILVIDCPVEQQIKRVKLRNKLSEEAIKAIIATQVSREQRLSAADDIIDNSGDTTKLAEHIKKLHNLYLTLGKDIN